MIAAPNTLSVCFDDTCYERGSRTSFPSIPPFSGKPYTTAIQQQKGDPHRRVQIMEPRIRLECLRIGIPEGSLLSFVPGTSFVGRVGHEVLQKNSIA